MKSDSMMALLQAGAISYSDSQTGDREREAEGWAADAVPREGDEIPDLSWAGWGWEARTPRLAWQGRLAIADRLL